MEQVELRDAKIDVELEDLTQVRDVLLVEDDVDADDAAPQEVPEACHSLLEGTRDAHQAVMEGLVVAVHGDRDFLEPALRAFGRRLGRRTCAIGDV
jgi:hypothetical protein